MLRKQDVSFCQKRSQEVWGLLFFFFFSCLFLFLSLSLIFLLLPSLAPSSPLPISVSTEHSQRESGDGGGRDAAVCKGGQQAQEQKPLCTPRVSAGQRIPSSHRVSIAFGCLCTVQGVYLNNLKADSFPSREPVTSQGWCLHMGIRLVWLWMPCRAACVFPIAKTAFSGSIFKNTVHIRRHTPFRILRLRGFAVN